MRAMRIATVVALLIASARTVQVVRAVQSENKPVSDNRKEQSHMTENKVIILIEAKIQPQRRADLIEALREYLPLVRAEPGVEAFYVTARKDDPNTLIFSRPTSRKLHRISICSRIFTKKFLATLESAHAADRVRTNLVELPLG